MFPPVAPFEAKFFDESFLENLLGEDANSVAVYPLSLVLDPKTRDTLIYNAKGTMIAMVHSDGIPGTWPEDADPSRVILQLDLLPAEDVEPYLYTESRIAESLAWSKAPSPKGGGSMQKGLGSTNFGFCNIQKLSFSNVLLTVTNGTDIAEVYSYTVMSTATVVVVTYTNEQSNVVTETNTYWTPVSPSFNGLDGTWECLTTNHVLTNGVGAWQDAAIPGNISARFYATARRVDSDTDGLTDGSEIFLYRTNPEAADTDGDALSDGEEIGTFQTDPLDADSDDDGLTDFEEVDTYETDPNAEDTDGDGMTDGWEVLYQLNPLSGLGDSLAGWWKLDDGTGTNALNSAQDAFHGDLQAFDGTTNSGWVAEGLLGGALRFDGVDDWIRIAQTPNLLTGGPFTVSAQVWLDSNCTSDWPEIVSDYNPTSWDGYCLGFDTNQAPYAMIGYSGWTEDTNTLTDQWVWVVLEYDGTNMCLYRDGVLVDGPASAGFVSATNEYFMIGNGQDPGYSEHWKGLIDDVRIYQSTIGTNGLTALYDAFDDIDDDGLTNLEEAQNGTHPDNCDTDGDTIPDGAEIDLGLDPLDAADAELDPDNDHLVNREEYELGLSMTTSNEVTMVYFNPGAGGGNKSSGGSTNYIYLTQENLEAKAVTTRRQKEGYAEFTDATLPPSEPPKWYLSQEQYYRGEGDGMDPDQYGGAYYRTHSESNYCLMEFDPDGWPTSPTNHICEGYGHLLSSSYDDECLRTRSGWDYSFNQPSTNVPEIEHYTHYQFCDSVPYVNITTSFWESCAFLFWTLPPEPYSHTEAFVSNDWNDYLLAWDIEDPDAYEMAWATLTNEYTDEMLQYYTESDLALITDWSGLDWEERWARTNHHDQAYVETLPSNEVYSACLISTNHDDLLLQDLQYRWTIPTTAGTVYKFMWLEAFRPQDSDTYTDYKLMSDAFMGTGSDVQTDTYTADRPWDRWDDPYGVIVPIGFLVELECDLAVTNQMGFGVDPSEIVCYPVWDEATAAAESDQSKINSALTVLFSNASTPEGDPTNFNVTLHVYPEDLPGVTWAKTDGPNSGTLLNSDQPIATFSNATKGGLYTFTTTIPGADPITSQLWLPVSGPDISVDFQREIDYLADWIGDYESYLATRVLAELHWNSIENSNTYSETKARLRWEDLVGLGVDFDYETSLAYLQDVCGLAHVGTTNDTAGDSARFVLPGNSRNYVTDFAKRNNMGYAMFARHLGYASWIIKIGPSAYSILGNKGAGSADDQYVMSSYDAGIDLADGVSLSGAMDNYAREMQHPEMRISMEWPGEGVAATNAIILLPTTKYSLDNLAGR